MLKQTGSLRIISAKTIGMALFFVLISFSGITYAKSPVLSTKKSKTALKENNILLNVALTAKADEITASTTPALTPISNTVGQAENANGPQPADNGTDQNSISMPTSLSIPSDQTITAPDGTNAAHATPTDTPPAPAAANTDQTSKKPTPAKKVSNKELAFNFTLPNSLAQTNDSLASAAVQKPIAAAHLPMLSMWEPFTEQSPYGFSRLNPATTSVLNIFSLLLLLTGLFTITNKGAPLNPRKNEDATMGEFINAH